MSGPCPTVRVKCEPCDGNPAGEVDINLSDYDPEIHTTVEDYELGVADARKELDEMAKPGGQESDQPGQKDKASGSITEGTQAGSQEPQTQHEAQTSQDQAAAPADGPEPKPEGPRKAKRDK